MRIGRTLPPAASPIPLIDIVRALPACLYPNSQNDQFKQEIQREYNVKHCFLLSSGKAALTIILLALKEIYPDRDQVIIPAFTCYSVPAAIKRAGLQISLCDLAPSSLDFDKLKLEGIIDKDKQKKNILCVLPTHLFGCRADITGIKTIVGPEIPIVEDTAQAMGESLNTKKLGTLGDIGFFSLGRGKALSTMGGGIIVTDRGDLANIIEVLIHSLTSHKLLDNIKEILETFMTTILQNPSMFWLPKGLPFFKLGETLYEPDLSLCQLSAFRIKLAKNWQKRLERHRLARKKNIIRWQGELPAEFIQLCCTTDVNMIRLPILAQTGAQRDYILEFSEQQGLGLMAAYPTPIHEITEIEEEFVGRQYPQARDTCDRLFTLPVHEFTSGVDYLKISNLLTHVVADVE